jgi:hypothetical protein
LETHAFIEKTVFVILPSEISGRVTEM